MADDGINDQVTLHFGGQEVLIAKSYSIRQSVISQPGEFHLTLGQAGTLQTLREMLLPNTPFELRINGNLRMTGRTDGYRITSSGSGASEMTVFGRDALAPLHDAHIPSEISFDDSTYSSLVKTILTACGLDPDLLVTSGNNINRKLMAGVPIRELLPVRTIEEILADDKTFDKNTTTQGATHQNLQSKIGERWYEFLRKQLDRAGLMIWASCDGRFILSAPNANLAPAYRILRRRGQLRNAVNVESVDLLNDTRPRYTFAIVYTRHGRGRNAHGQSKGNATDTEMVKLGFGRDLEIQQQSQGGFILPVRTQEEIKKATSQPKQSGHVEIIRGNTRALVVKDHYCQNTSQAGYLAARKLAEARRHGFQLVYTLAGHSTPTALGRAVWTPDTVVEVDDEELGLQGNFWIESVEFHRQPQSTTVIRMMRPEDVVFGSPGE